MQNKIEIREESEFQKSFRLKAEKRNKEMQELKQSPDIKPYFEEFLYSNNKINCYSGDIGKKELFVIKDFSCDGFSTYIAVEAYHVNSNKVLKFTLKAITAQDVIDVFKSRFMFLSKKEERSKKTRNLGTKYEEIKKQKAE